MNPYKNASKVDIRAVKVMTSPTNEEVNQDHDGNNNDSSSSSDENQDDDALFKVTKSKTNLTFNRPPASCYEFIKAVKSLDDPDAINTVRFNNSNCHKETFDLDADLDKLLPNIKELYVNHEILSGLNLRSTKLETLDVGRHDGEVGDRRTRVSNRFSFRLPSLITLYVEYVWLEDPSDLARSLSASPKLKTCNICNIGGMDMEPTWYLPSCTYFELYNSTMTRLILYCPRVQCVDLDHSKSLLRVTFVTRGKAEHEEYNIKREEDMTRFNLTMDGVRSKKLWHSMMGHHRVAKVYPSDFNSDNLHLDY